MTERLPSLPGFAVHPLTPDRWEDFVTLFGRRGACGGCWCMMWRLTAPEFAKKKGPGNKRAMKPIVASGKIPGLLAYLGNEPVGWCAVGPREWYSRFERSRILKPVDDQPVWSVVCFFIAKPHRKKKLTVRLLQAAAEYAKTRGARIVEGYPTEPKQGSMPDVFAFVGLASAFRQAGFTEVARRSPTRPIMRRYL